MTHKPKSFLHIILFGCARSFSINTTESVSIKVSRSFELLVLNQHSFEAWKQVKPAKSFIFTHQLGLSSHSTEGYGLNQQYGNMGI